MEQTRDIMTIVGSNVKKYREEAGFTQSHLGGCFGATSNRIKMIEGGMADLKLSTLSKLAEYLDVKVIDLVEDWEDEEDGEC